MTTITQRQPLPTITNLPTVAHRTLWNPTTSLWPKPWSFEKEKKKKKNPQHSKHHRIASPIGPNQLSSKSHPNNFHPPISPPPPSNTQPTPAWRFVSRLAPPLTPTTHLTSDYIALRLHLLAYPLAHCQSSAAMPTEPFCPPADLLHHQSTAQPRHLRPMPCYPHELHSPCFFYFFIRVMSLKNAKRNQVHMEYTRKAAKKKKKTIQGKH
jgi:hypothetical protein